MANAVVLDGVYPIPGTPFDDAEGIDLPSLAKAVRFRTAAGASGGDLPVVAGCGHRGTRFARTFLREDLILPFRGSA